MGAGVHTVQGRLQARSHQEGAALAYMCREDIAGISCKMAAAHMKSNQGAPHGA